MDTDGLRVVPSASGGDRVVTQTPERAAIAAQLKLALRRLPGPVSLITTCEADGSAPAGMVASAVIPVTMDPPSMLVAVNQSASTHGVISRSQRFCINLLGTGQSGLVGIFSNHLTREQRFTQGDWRYVDGLPYLADACSSLFCRVSETLVFGTHELFIGEVEEVREDDADSGDPLGWLRGDFARLGRLA